MASMLDSIAPVDIDVGRFKYVLIRVDFEDPAAGGAEVSKVIVRGYSWAAYHGKSSLRICLLGQSSLQHPTVAPSSGLLEMSIRMNLVNRLQLQRDSADLQVLE